MIYQENSSAAIRSAPPAWRRLASSRLLPRATIGLLVCAVLHAVAPSALAAVTPTATLSVPATPMIGQSPFSFTVTFDNTGAGSEVGYGPYVDLFLPRGGADGTSSSGANDGITFTSATFLGSAVTAVILSCTPGGSVVHPMTGLTITCPALPAGAQGSSGTYWQFVNLELPFGSFTPGQPPAAVTVNTTLSNLADLGFGLPIRATAGFRYGTDALDNASTDPPIQGATASATTTPILMTLAKLYSGPEDETATGPNFTREYTITLDIAVGQTVTNTVVTDYLPTNMQFVSVVSTSPSTTCGPLPSTTVPGGTLQCTFATLTGAGGSPDASVVMRYYIPLNDAAAAPVLNAVSGDDAVSNNNADAVGNWLPIDTRDTDGLGNATAGSSGNPPEHVLTDKSIAIQKSVANVTDSTNSPTDVLEFTLSVQISDFFAFQTVDVTDVISDGLHYQSSFAPTMLVNGNAFTLATLGMNAANVDVACNYTGGPGAECDTSDPATNDGKTTIVFNLSDELVTRGRANGRLLGGCVQPAGNADYDCNPYNDGATTVTIKFRAVIQDVFANTFPSGDPSVDQNDVLSNTVSAAGALLNNTTMVLTGQSEADDSAASLSIAIGQLTKFVYAINGSTTCPPTGSCATPQAGVGDTVTYRLRYTLPTSDFETVSLTDYLPLPVFLATQLTTFSNTVCGVPTAGNACLGPADTYHSLSGAVTPVMTTAASDNSVKFNYGNYDNVTNPASEIDLLLTVTTRSDPFTDGLFLTNEVHVFEGTTNAGTLQRDAIVQIRLREPLLAIRKGVITTTVASGATFAPTTVLPTNVSVSAPGGSCPRLSGTGMPVRSGTTGNGALASTFNSNLTGPDAGDRVTYAIVIENTGREDAFDVRISDTLPAGLLVPVGGLNLCVTDGTGAVITTTNVGGGTGLLGQGIELVDPGPTLSPPGALDPGKDSVEPTAGITTTGRNVAILTFDLQVTNTVAPGQTLNLLNTASLFNYSTVEGGPDFTPTDKTDTAQVTVAPGTRTKFIMATSEATTANVGGIERLAIGEVIRYRLVWQIPDATATNAQFLDNLPTGLTYLDDGTARVAFVSNGAGLASSNFGTLPIPAIPGGCTLTGSAADGTTPAAPLPCLLSDANVGSSNSSSADTDSYASGGDPFFKFGTLVNNDIDADSEYVVVEFNALVDNTTGNDYGATRNNTFVPQVSAASVGSNSAAVNASISEPCLGTLSGTTCTSNLSKTIISAPSPADAGGTVAYRITFSNTTGVNIANAFDVHVTDTLPASLALNLGSVVVTLGSGSTGVTNTSSGNLVDVTVGNMPPGGTAQIDFTATVLAGALAGGDVDNTALLSYTSLPGANGTCTNATGSCNTGTAGTASGERTGGGGSINDYAGNDVVSFTANAPGIDKLTPSPTSYLPGSVVTYTLLVTLPEGTTQGLSVVDDLPPGLAYVAGSAQVITTAAGSGGLLGADFSGSLPAPSVTAPGGSGGDVTLSFAGNILVPGDNNAANNSFLVRLRATVLSNPNGTVLTNNAAARYTDPETGTTDVPDPTPPIITVATAMLGNSVWLDENGDGRQDAGEAGIANVTVQLWDAGHTTLLGTTVTDVQGHYRFLDLALGTYQVDVLGSSLPAGLVQTTVPAGGGDMVNHADPFTVTLVGDENLTADFGYNWAPSSDVTGNTGTGAIGDRVWVDTDGDGRQDVGEIGLAGVTVDLMTAGADGLFGTADDVVAATTATSSTGNYIFDGLAAGAYAVRVNGGAVPAGYAQTGDPDHFGTTGTNDNRTTTPIVLGPGDVFVNADFGYQPSAGSFGSIGDFVWLDADADGVQDAGEPGIAGVTVALVKDTNGNGVWDAGEPIVATTVTGSTGNYLFGGLPVADGAGTDDYLVWVNDTDHVLGLLVPTFDRDGLIAPAGGVVSGAGIAAVSNLAPAGVTDADFGYTAIGQTAGKGLIGDTIFLDRNGNGTPQAGEGVEGVLVELYDSTGTTLLASTVTDENGSYVFGGLDIGGGGTTYQVRVAAANFASGAVLQGLANSVDPDAGTASRSQVTLTAGAPTNLAQDFGYVPSGTAGSIGNLVWADTDADGFKDASETGLAGVTVDLYRDLNGNGRLDAGEPRVGTATTAADGSYLFSNLPTADNGAGASGADFFVDVSDSGGVLAGYWHSLGTAGTNDNSQADGYAASVSAGAPSNLTADFGYFVQSASAGNFAWNDLDGDGRQDAGEPGLPGVTVTLTVTYPAGGVTTLKTVTDITGRYSFGNLLQDENYNGDGIGPEPTFALTFSPPAGFVPTTANAAAVPDTLDSDWNGTVPATVQPVKGQNDTSLANITDAYAAADAGFVPAGSIGDFVWADTDRDGLQDGGEPGLPNVTVRLYLDDGDGVYEPGTGDALVATTVTDGDGAYLFKNLPAGRFWVAVDTATVPSGLVAQYDEDGGTATPDGKTLLTLAAGADHLTADFGYGPADTGNSSVLGDRVWYDADANGQQDDGEVGIGGVQIRVVGPSGTFTLTTAPDGSWLVGSLATGNYTVTVITSTLPAGLNTTPTNGAATRLIQVPANTAVLYADFGFNGGTVGTIGNTVWLDLDRDGVGPVILGEQQGGAGTADNGEPPISGVSVSLIQDRNGDGIWDPDGVDNILGNADDERIIATDVTDANGRYLFVGVPITDGVGTDDYLVLIGDRDNVLAGMTATYDADGAAGGGGAAQANSVLGLSRVQDLTGTPVTNQDFGYAPPGGFIGNLVWHDLNSDGNFDTGEPAFEGVLMELFLDVNGDGAVDGGDTLLGTTTTDVSGHYFFDGLPTGTVKYLVRVASSNTAGGAVLGGMTKTNGVAGLDDNSQANPYSVTLTPAAPANLTADFGYRAATPFTLSGTTFEDVNNNGATVPTFEPGIDNTLKSVPVLLYKDTNGNGVLDPGEPLIATVLSGSNGFYQFTDLAPGSYIVATEAMQAYPNGFFQTTQQATRAVEPVTIVASNVTNRDFGFWVPGGATTTPVTIAYFRATRSGDRVRFEWQTETETGNVGFYLYEVTETGLRRLNTRLIQSSQLDSLAPAAYAFEATGVTGDRYVIEDVNSLLQTRRHGAFEANVEYGAKSDAVPIDWAAIHAEDDRLAAGRDAAARVETKARIGAAVEADRDAESATNNIGSAFDRVEDLAGIGSALDRVDDVAGMGSAFDRDDGSADVSPGKSTEDDAAGVASVGVASAGAQSADGLSQTPIVAATTGAPILARLKVSRDGMVRVTYEALLAVGFDLKGVAVNKLAVVNRGLPVSIWVESTGRAFGPGSFVDFYGEAAKGLYTRTNVYDLVADKRLRLAIRPFKTAERTSGLPAASYMETLAVDRNRSYATTSPNGDPWYDTRMLVYASSPGSWSFPLTVDHLVAGAATLAVKTWGATEWGGAPDHHVQLALNGAVVADRRFDGLVADEPRVPLASGVLREGANELQLTMPGDTGFDFDLVNLDGYTVSYPRAFVARGGGLTFTAKAPLFRVTGLPLGPVVVYRFADGQAPVRYDRVVAMKEADGTYSVAFQGFATSARYEVLGASALGSAAIEAVRAPGDVTATGMDYVVVAHPNFMAGVQPLVADHRRRGLKVKVVDVRDVFDRYGFGNFDPQAIKRYVADLHAQKVRYVLLVGGDTYDYRNDANPGAISFIPTLYARTDRIVTFAPVDPQFADVDGDGVPDLAIGRLPVRTTAELDTVVAKTLAYAKKAYQKTAVFAADAVDPLVNFTADSASLVATLPIGWAVERVNLDELGLAEARSRLIGKINEGVALTSFMGHSGPTAWTFSGLFRSSDAAALTNAGKPTVVTQWGCWNTYFVSPSYDTLGHTFLLSGDRGAAAVLGASTLTDAESEEKLGHLIMPRLTTPGTTIGEAVLAAKRELATTDPGLADVMLGWTLLGDPALVVAP